MRARGGRATGLRASKPNAQPAIEHSPDDLADQPPMSACRHGEERDWRPLPVIAAVVVPAAAVLIGAVILRRLNSPRASGDGIVRNCLLRKSNRVFVSQGMRSISGCKR